MKINRNDNTLLNRLLFLFRKSSSPPVAANLNVFKLRSERGNIEIPLKLNNVFGGSVPVMENY